MNRITKYKMCGYFDATPMSKLLYVVLDELAGESGEAVISQRRVCEALRLSRSAVSRNLRKLEHEGAISIKPTFHNDGGRAANKYILR